MARLILLWLTSAVLGLAVVTAAVRQTDLQRATQHSLAAVDAIASTWVGEFETLIEPNLAIDAMPGVAGLVTSIANPKIGLTGASLILPSGQPIAHSGTLPAVPDGAIAALFGGARAVLRGTDRPPARIVGDRVICVPVYDWTGQARGALVLAYTIATPLILLPWREALGLLAVAAGLAVFLLRSRRVDGHITVLAVGLALSLGIASLSIGLRHSGFEMALLIPSVLQGAAIALAVALVFAEIGACIAPARLCRRSRETRLDTQVPGPICFTAGCAVVAPWLAVFGVGVALPSIVMLLCGILLGAAGTSAITERHGWRVAALPGGICEVFGLGLVGVVADPLFVTAGWSLIGLGGGLVTVALFRRCDRRSSRSSFVAGQLATLAFGAAILGAFGAGFVLPLASVLALAASTAIARMRNDEAAPLRFLVKRSERVSAPNAVDRLRAVLGAIRPRIATRGFVREPLPLPRGLSRVGR